MDGRIPPERGNEVLEVSYVEDNDKAKQFAKTCKSFSKLPVCKEDRIIRRYVRKRMKRRPIVQEESEQDSTMEEVERAIDESKKNKAPVEDNNPYEFLKNLGSTAKELLLLYKMEKLNIPLRFIRYVKHFLSGHKTRVDINRIKSDPFRFDEGLPQGSSISPLLFLIFINDIHVDLDADTTASFSADDTVT